jgi:hypothetical protein
MSTFAERLKENLSPLENTDPAWIKYVKDHRGVILESVVVQTIPPEKMHPNKYRCSSLLHELGYDEALSWIVIWLNQIDNNRNFIDLVSIKIPDIETIKTLRAQFDTFNAKASETQSV